jgi:hypothetical protein
MAAAKHFDLMIVLSITGNYAEAVRTIPGYKDRGIS